MLERAFSNMGRSYLLWMGSLVAVMTVGYGVHLLDFHPGMSRDVSWGLHIAQFTFFVGVAASALMVVLPYYIHNMKEFGRITLLGEFLAVTAVIVCLLFIVLDLGMPHRLWNVVFYPTPHSPLFWDVVVLNGYILINLILGWKMLEAEHQNVPPPSWTRWVVYMSLPWAVSIHAVTAFIYAGLPGRDLWLTALLAPKFLASAFAAGPALLILLCAALKRFARFDAGAAALEKLSVVVMYATATVVVMELSEFFTSFYAGIPSHMHSLEYLFFGLDGYHALTPLMWVYVFLLLSALFIMLRPNLRNGAKTRLVGCAAVFFAMMIEKGLALTVAGFIPNPFGRVTEYVPTWSELIVMVGVWATGAFLISLFYRLVISVKGSEG
jgi:molybdopterin-containing oxidoreductase family membrane subunit